jgi:hypothetical protein
MASLILSIANIREWEGKSRGASELARYFTKGPARGRECQSEGRQYIKEADGEEKVLKDKHRSDAITHLCHPAD